MEQLLIAVPYPMTGSVFDWGTVCPAHPTWLGGNVPTDRNRGSAEAFAEAQACRHPEHFGVTDVHVVSATQIVTDDGQHTLAMCGVDMGAHADIPSCHPIGNYLWESSPLWEIVTCTECLTRNRKA